MTGIFVLVGLILAGIVALTVMKIKSNRSDAREQKSRWARINSLK